MLKKEEKRYSSAGGHSGPQLAGLLSCSQCWHSRPAASLVVAAGLVAPGGRLTRALASMSMSMAGKEASAWGHSTAHRFARFLL